VDESELGVVVAGPDAPRLAGSSADIHRQLGERLFGELLSHAPIGAVLVDLAGRIVAWNVVAGRLLDLRDRDSVGSSLTGLFADSSAVAVHLGLRPPTADAPGPVSPLPTFTITGPSGRARQLRLTGPPTSDDAGRARVLVIAEDRTEAVHRQREIIRRGRHSAATAQVAAAMTASGSSDIRLQRCADALTDEMRLAGAAIWTTDDSTGSVRLRAATRDTVLTGDAARHAAADALLAEPGPHRDAIPASAFYPLTSGGLRVGVLGVTSAEPIDEATHTALTAIAGHLAVGIRQDTLHRQVQAVADALQKPLLPPRLPRIPGLELAGRYRAHGDHTRIGGDFYDVFELRDGRHVLVLGDVCGKGPAAAAVTGQVRHTIWTAAQHRPDAGYVLNLVNDTLLRNGDARFCTLAYTVLDTRSPHGPNLEITCAGHPAPILYRGGVAAPAQARGRLLGVTPGLQFRTQRITLAAGDAVVYYTDGLTEGAGALHQREPADIAAEVAGLALTGGAATIADGLVAGSVRAFGANVRDDIAVLALSVAEADD
jgi:serine phosphatase RsbU (regulator of sigma subunit)